jgi:hypothetical protein
VAEQDPFISVADLEASIGASIADPNSLSVKITLDSACQAVRTYLGQTINLVTGDVEIHSGRYGKKIRLRQRPVRSVTSVVVDDEVIDPTNYSVRGHVVTLIDGSLWWKGNDNVEITYDHGWDLSEASDDNVPTDIRYVALSIARRIWNDLGADTAAGAIVSETIGDYSYTLSEAALSAVATVSALTGGEQAALDPYRIELVGDTPTQY